MKNILTEKEVSAVISMNWYWEEVSKRHDTSPLQHEVEQLCRALGTKILWIVAEYAKARKEGGEQE